MKLNNRDVVAINTLRQMGYKQNVLADMFGVSQRDISYHCSPKSNKTTKAYAKKYRESKKTN